MRKKLGSKLEVTRIDHRGQRQVLDNARPVKLGDIYLNDLSVLQQLELRNLTDESLVVGLQTELEPPFDTSYASLQLENENLELTQEFSTSHVNCPNDKTLPDCMLQRESEDQLQSFHTYLHDSYNELFNHIGATDEVTLGPKEKKMIYFSLCTKRNAKHNENTGDKSRDVEDITWSSLLGSLFLTTKTNQKDSQEIVVPLQARVCRSMLRLDVKELHFDDCVPGGAFEKEFTIWNRSEIPLFFKLVTPLTVSDEEKQILSCFEQSSGLPIADRILKADAHGSVTIKVSFHPTDVGERYFEIHVQNLHDSRNVKILDVHTVTNEEHHREGLSIRNEDGITLVSGDNLDFGDCYAGLAASKTLLIRNTTASTLHVELSSERPKEITFELKPLQNREPTARSKHLDEPLSPMLSPELVPSTRAQSPDAQKSGGNDMAGTSFSNLDTLPALGVGDSDEEVEEDDDINLYEDDFLQPKRNSFEETAMEDADVDDDFEFDREPRGRQHDYSPTKDSDESRDTWTRTSHRGSDTSKMSRQASRNHDLGYDDSRSMDDDSRPTSPETRASTPDEGVSSAANFLVETIDVNPGVERTILVWYCPPPAPFDAENADTMDVKGGRLTKQHFRVQFRCFEHQGPWDQAQNRVYDRTLGKSLDVRARTCTSLVTVTPSTLHLGGCNIGELKSSSCVVTNHSELPTTIKPIVTSKVVSTVPNDELELLPKQSAELKVELIPRKTNRNYSRLISVVNLKNKANAPQICVRSSNMEAHHVIYHSLFYRLLTSSNTAILSFDHIALNSIGLQVFALENVTNAPLRLSLQSSDQSRVKLYWVQPPVSEQEQRGRSSLERRQPPSGSLPPGSSRPQRLQNSERSGTSASSPGTKSLFSQRRVRRRRSLGSISELQKSSRKKPSSLKTYLSRNNNATSADKSTDSSDTSVRKKGRTRDSFSERPPSDRLTRSSTSSQSSDTSLDTSNDELTALLQLFESSKHECEAYCQSNVTSYEREKELVAMIRDRQKRFQSLLTASRLTLVGGSRMRNIRLPAKSRQRFVVAFTPSADDSESIAPGTLRMEKHKVFLTLPPGGNKKAVADNTAPSQVKTTWATVRHPFDSRPSVRELLVKGRVCRSVLDVNQKNINFGRMTAGSKSSKRVIVRNLSAVPLVYDVEKTGSISSGFLQIKKGQVGVVEAFGTRDISFEFQPTLAGPFEERLRIVNVQDEDNFVSVTIKAKVVKQETFKLPQAGRIFSLGKCLSGEKTSSVKVSIRNTSHKKREYVIQADAASFQSADKLRPTFYFSVDEAPSTSITQAQEQKLDEDLEKLEHKLRIAQTKNKTDKIVKLSAKISRVTALLNGEEVPGESTDGKDFESASETASVLEDEGRQIEDAVNSLHFTLDAEATGRIVVYAVFHPEGEEGERKGEQPRSQWTKRRQFRRHETPRSCEGKLLLFEQKNKDVVKELQYKAEVYMKSQVGEKAYARAVEREKEANVATSGVRAPATNEVKDSEDNGKKEREEDAQR